MPYEDDVYEARSIHSFIAKHIKKPNDRLFNHYAKSNNNLF